MNHEEEGKRGRGGGEEEIIQGGMLFELWRSNAEPLKSKYKERVNSLSHQESPAENSSIIYL